jgi:hypothetical protein
MFETLVIVKKQVVRFFKEDKKKRRMSGLQNLFHLCLIKEIKPVYYSNRKK